MNNGIRGLIFALISTQVLAETATKTPAPSTPPSSPQDVSYSFGAVLGKRMRTDIPGLDVAAFVQGFSAAAAEQPTRLTDEQMLAVISSFQRDMQQKQLGKIQQLAADNQKAEAEFLAANQKKEGVVTLLSGLQYQILVEGVGPQAGPSDVVTLHYTGTLRNGKVFDSSRNGAPVDVSVSAAIPGWTEALQLMPQGSKWQLFIPSKLAYGTNGNRQIGPNELLVYEIEVLAVKHR